MKAPAAKPSRVSAPTIKPCRYPQRARAKVKATIAQSNTVTPQISPCRGSLLYLSAVNQTPTEAERRRRILTRALPLGAVALVAFVVGITAGTPGSPEK